MKKYCVIMLLSIIAFINAGYLTAKAYGLLPGPSFCDINGSLSCDVAMSHPAAYIGPIAFPAVALVVYPILFLLARWGKRSGDKGENTQRTYKTLAFLALAGILYNSYFIYQETFVIGAFCPLCLACTAIIIIICILSLLGWKKG